LRYFYSMRYFYSIFESTYVTSNENFAWVHYIKKVRWPTTSNKLYKLPCHLNTESDTLHINNSQKAKLSMASCREIKPGICVTGALVADSLFFAVETSTQEV